MRAHVALLLAVCCGFASGDIGATNFVLRKQLHACVTQAVVEGGSLLHSLRLILHCTTEHLYPCALYRDVREEPAVFQTPYCGVLNTGNTLPTSDWNFRITVQRQFIARIQLFHFYLPSSKHCRNGSSLELKAKETLSKRIRGLVYCGHRKPWSISFMSKQVRIMCNKCLRLRGFYFVLGYEALDIHATSVHLVHWRNKRFAFTYFQSAHDYKYPQLELQFLLTFGREVVTLYYSPDALKDIVVYDGPGALSPTITPKQVSPGPLTRRVRFSTGRGFFKLILVIEAKSRAKAYAKAPYFVDRYAPHMKFSAVVKELQECAYDSDGKVRFTSNGPRDSCVIRQRIDLIIIHKLEFIGFNMFRHNKPGTCEYGGLSITALPPMCANITRRTHMPYVENKVIKLVFETFKGYSSGFVDMTLMLDYGCFGTNIVVEEMDSAQPEITIWADSSNTTLRRDPSIEECYEMWFVKNMKTELEGKPKNISNLPKLLEHPSDMLVNYYYHWKFRNYETYSFSTLKVSGSAYSRTTFEHNVQIKERLDVSLKVATGESGNPFNHSTTRVNGSLLQDDIQIHHYSLLLNMFLDYVGHNPYPVINVRLQFIKTGFCASVFFHRSMDVSQTFQLPADSLGEDVYISRDFYINEVWTRALGHRGRNLGACRLLIAGEPTPLPPGCKHRTTRISIDAIELDTSLQLDVSQKQSASCSSQCLLQVLIEEKRPHDVTHRTQWLRVRRVTWLLKNLYFSVIHVTSHCPQCGDKACDIAVAIQPLKPWGSVFLREDWKFDQLKTLSQIFGDYLTPDIDEILNAYRKEIVLKVGPHWWPFAEDKVYWSWNDARDKCSAQGYYLTTWTPLLADHLARMIHMRATNKYGPGITLTERFTMKRPFFHKVRYVFAGLSRRNSDSPWMWNDGSTVGHIGWGQVYQHPNYGPILNESCPQCNVMDAMNGSTSQNRHCTAFESFQRTLTIFPVHCDQKLWTVGVCQKTPQIYTPEIRENMRENAIKTQSKGEYIITDNSLVQNTALCPAQFNYEVSSSCMRLVLVDDTFLKLSRGKKLKDDIAYSVLTNQTCPGGSIREVDSIFERLALHLDSQPLFDILTAFYAEGADVILPQNIPPTPYVYLPGSTYPKYFPCLASRKDIGSPQLAGPVSLFSCHDGSVIADARRCNGRPDCPKGEDELQCASCSVEPCRHSCNVPYCTCALFYYQCESGECVHYDHVCDSIPDCPSGDDETFCHNKKVFRNFDGKFISSLSIVDLCDPPSGDLLMCRTELQCYNASAICHYDHSDGVLAHCADASHLGTGTLCTYIECSRHQYKCHESYCIPSRKVCDGVQDCPIGDDEGSCGAYKCPGHLRCSGVTFCVSPHEVCDGIAHCPQQEDEKHCQSCPFDCECKGTAMYCSNVTGIAYNLTEQPDHFTSPSALVLHNSYDLFEMVLERKILQTEAHVWLIDLMYGSFHALLGRGITLVSVKFLHLNHQGIHTLTQNFITAPNLLYLNLSNNDIVSFDKHAFAGTTNLRVLALESNSLQTLSSDFCDELSALSHLYLRGNPLVSVAPNVFRENGGLLVIRSDWYMVCCVAPGVKDCEPQNQFVSSCSDLISSLPQRVVIMLQGVVIVIGNLAALGLNFGLKLFSEVDKFVMVSLALADLQMGVYLLGISSFDLAYTGVFYKVVSGWTSGIPCMFFGVFNFISSEVSMVLLSILSMARVTSVHKVGGTSRMKSRVQIASVCAWVLFSAIGVAYVGYLLVNDMSLRNNMCILLGISNQRFVTRFEHVFQVLFITFNMLVLLLLAASMWGIFGIVLQSSKSIQHVTGKKEKRRDARLAVVGVRIVLLLVCNVVSWLPFLIVSTLLVAGKNVHENALQWVSIVCIPICASTDPILYTLVALKARKTKATKQNTSNSGNRTTRTT